MPKLNKQERETLRMLFGGNCAYCGYPLPEKGWHADHVEPVKRDWEFVKDANGHQVNRNGVSVTRATGKLFKPENDTKENLFPACRACNIEKGCESVEGFRIGIERKVRVLRDNYATFRHAERFGRVTIIEGPVIFYFEKLALSNYEKAQPE